MQNRPDIDDGARTTAAYWNDDTARTKTAAVEVTGKLRGTGDPIGFP